MAEAIFLSCSKTQSFPPTSTTSHSRDHTHIVRLMSLVSLELDPRQNCFQVFPPKGHVRTRMTEIDVGRVAVDVVRRECRWT
jgi:hypothetical protein